MREDIFRRISDALDADGAFSGIDEALREELEREPQAAAYARDLQTISQGLRHFRIEDLDDKGKARALATKTELKLRGRFSLEEIGDPTAPPRFVDDTVEDGFFSSIPTSEIDMTEYESMPPPTPDAAKPGAPHALNAKLIGFHPASDVLAPSARSARAVQAVSLAPTEEIDLLSLPPGAMMTTPPGLTVSAADANSPTALPRNEGQPPAVPPPPRREVTDSQPRVDADGRIVGAAPAPSSSIHDRISLPTMPGVPISIAPPSEPPPRSRPYLWLGAVAVAALLAIGVFVGTRGSNSSSTDPNAELAEAVGAVALAPTGAAAMLDSVEPSVAEAEPPDETADVVAVADPVAEPGSGDPAEGELATEDIESDPSSRGEGEQAGSTTRSHRASHPRHAPRIPDPSGPEARRAVPERAPRSLPDAPERGAVLAAIRRVEPAVRACARDVHGDARVEIVIGGSGRVRNAVVTGRFAGTPVGSCVARTVRTRARFPAFRQDSLTVVYPFSI